MRALVRFLAVVGAAGAGLAVGLGLLAPQVKGFFTAAEAGEPNDVVKLGELAQNSVVYARDGSVLAVLHAEENRFPVELEQVPQHVVDAILDVEDDGFWNHGGVNLRSSVRALVSNVSAGEVVQGGSTITQQLVKNALLTPEKSLERKVREAVLAVRLEDRLSKPEILKRYLNTVYFGNGAYGVQAAAQTYFDVDVDKLTVGQAAVLAGIIRNPLGYDPLRNPAQARSRRNFALDRMVQNGHLSAADATRLRQEPLPTQLSVAPPPQDYFVEEVKQTLLEDPRLGETPLERYNALFKGGLRIYTTLDPGLQRMALEHRNRILPSKITRGRFTSALVSMEFTTGYVRAMVAGDDFAAAKYNLATGRGGSGRQPGSSYKPFVLLAALEAGYGPNDTINGTSPCTITLPGHAPYTPGNYEGSSGGVMSVTEATAKSVNCAYARLGAEVGLERVVDMANRLRLAKQKPLPYPSISLGAQEVTPLEMAAAYATIANDGVYHAPKFVESVHDRNGRVVFEGPGEGTKVVEPQTARVAMKVMESVVTGGTGTRARLRGHPAWGKTGTSQNHENAWFVGASQGPDVKLATAVWMGAPEGNVPMLNVGGVRVTGGTYPARIWGAFMTDALRGQPFLAFPAPDPRLIPRGKFIGPAPEVTAPPQQQVERREEAPVQVQRPRPSPTTIVVDDDPAPQVTRPTRPQVQRPPVTYTVPPQYQQPQYTVPAYPNFPRG